MKYIYLIGLLYIMTGCGVENNINFSTTQGNCADGSTNASYCMAVQIQNNNGGQNYINSTNYPINNLTLSVSGASNVGYPTAQGSSNDPNNCLGSTINPGSSCTFYLWLTGESFPVGSHVPINITANYTVNNTLPWVTSSNTASSSLTVYETPGLQISNKTGYVQVYNNNGFNNAYWAESETTANAVANDNYYGFLYLAGNNGIYFSGNNTYAGNATSGSSSIKGAINLQINGQSIYGTPNGSLSTSVYSANMQKESFSWTQYATGLTNTATNISTINGSRLFFTQSTSPSVYLCNPTSSAGSSCTPEGIAIPSAQTINAIGFTTLGTLNGNALTGLVAGTNIGLYVESGTIGSSTNQWAQVVTGSGGGISTSISLITADYSSNLYIADSSGGFYQLPINGSNIANKYTWTVNNPVAMVVNNAAVGGAQLFVATSSGAIYSCPLTTGTSCTQIGNSIFTNNILGLNIITQLTSG